MHTSPKNNENSMTTQFEETSAKLKKIVQTRVAQIKAVLAAYISHETDSTNDGAEVSIALLEMAIDRYIEYLRQVLRSESWQLLRRRPPIFAATDDPMSAMRGLMLGHIKRVWSGG